MSGSRRESKKPQSGALVSGIQDVCMDLNSKGEAVMPSQKPLISCSV